MLFSHVLQSDWFLPFWSLLRVRSASLDDSKAAKQILFGSRRKPVSQTTAGLVSVLAGDMYF